MTTTLSATKPTVRYHPVRGAIYGLLVGLGLALLLMVFKVLALSVPLIIVLGLVFLVLGGVWGRFAPPRGAKNAPPARSATMSDRPRTTTMAEQEPAPSQQQQPQPPPPPAQQQPPPPPAQPPPAQQQPPPAPSA